MPSLGMNARLAITAAAWFLLLFLFEIGFNSLYYRSPTTRATRDFRDMLLWEYPYTGWYLTAAAIGLSIFTFFMLGKPVKDNNAVQKSDS
jgi:hypothetical protein